MKKPVKIWGIIEGPITHEEYADGLGKDMPEGFNCVMLCKVEVNGEIDAQNFWFETFDEAYEWKKHFDKNIEPLEIESNFMEGKYNG